MEINKSATVASRRDNSTGTGKCEKVVLFQLRPDDWEGIIQARKVVVRGRMAQCKGSSRGSSICEGQEVSRGPGPVREPKVGACGWSTSYVSYRRRD